MTTSPKSLPPLALLIEDEVQIRRLLRVALESSGYRVEEASLGKQGISEVALKKPDVIILDLGLPDMEGSEALRRIREWSQTPVLVASVRDAATEKIAALDAGADDYVTKPFDTEELLARLRAIQRRAASTEESPRIECGSLTIDLLTQQALLSDLSLRLTPTEYQLLKTLATFAGRIMTHQQLLTEVWGPQGEGQTNALRVYINGLRKKLQTDARAPRIINEPGIGYRLVHAEA